METELLTSISSAACQAKLNRSQCQFLADQCRTLVDLASTCPTQGKRRVPGLLQRVLEVARNCGDEHRWIWEAVVKLEDSTGFRHLCLQLRDCILDMVSEALEENLLEVDQAFDWLGRANMITESCASETRARLAALARVDREELLATAKQQQSNAEIFQFLVRRLENSSSILQIYSSDSLELARTSSGFSGIKGALWGYPVVVTKLQDWEGNTDSRVVGIVEKDGNTLVVSDIDRVDQIRELARYRMGEILEALSSMTSGDAYAYDDPSMELILALACCELNILVQETTKSYQRQFLEEALSILTKSLLMLEHWISIDEKRKVQVQSILVEIISLVEYYAWEQQELRDRLSALLSTILDDAEHQQGTTSTLVEELQQGTTLEGLGQLAALKMEELSQASLEAEMCVAECQVLHCACLELMSKLLSGGSQDAESVRKLVSMLAEAVHLVEKCGLEIPAMQEAFAVEFQELTSKILDYFH